MKFTSTFLVVLATAMAAQSCPFFMSLDDANSCVFDPWRALSGALEDTALALRRDKRQAPVSSNCPYCASGVLMLYPDWSDISCSSFFFCFSGFNTKFVCDSTRPYFNPTTKACENIPSPTNNCIYRSFSLLS